VPYPIFGRKRKVFSIIETIKKNWAYKGSGFPILPENECSGQY
jgi:hypothetical protein